MKEELFGWGGTFFSIKILNEAAQKQIHAQPPGKMPLSQAWFISLTVIHFHSLQSC